MHAGFNKKSMDGHCSERQSYTIIEHYMMLRPHHQLPQELGGNWTASRLRTPSRLGETGSTLWMDGCGKSVHNEAVVTALVDRLMACWEWRTVPEWNIAAPPPRRSQETTKGRKTESSIERSVFTHCPKDQTSGWHSGEDTNKGCT